MAASFATTIKTLIASILLWLLIHVSVANAIGVCYGKLGSNLPPEAEVVSLYKSNGVNKMRIYWPDRQTLDALRGSNIELIVDVPRDQLRTLADPTAAAQWVQTNVVSYSSDVRFRYIAVGNEVLPGSGEAPYVLPAMRSIHAAVSAANLNSRIKVTTAIDMRLIANSYPPSHGVFTDSGYAAPIVRFLAENGAPLLVNIYPYFSHVDNQGSIDLRYALFEASHGEYRGLFDAQLDSVYAALEKVGGGGVAVVVSESGWPSEGGVAATAENAAKYYRNLIERVKSGRGTPMRPQLGQIETYLFAMFDENEKSGDAVERHFGLFTPDKRPKYQISLG